jgi:hypothetical protein
VAKKNIEYPIVGCIIRNARGIEYMSENTNIVYREKLPPKMYEGDEFYSIFRLYLPYLPTGEYFFGGAIAEGVVDGSHVQHHRRDDALKFTVVNSHVFYGMFSTPITRCAIYKIN